MAQVHYYRKDRARLLGTWSKQKSGSIRGFKTFPHRNCCGQDTSLSQKGQVQQHSTPRAQDGKALDVPPLLSFPFQKIGGGGGGSRHACEESATYLEIRVGGNSLEEKLCQLLLQVGEASHRGDPTTGKQTSSSGTPVAQEVQFTFPFQWTRLLDKAFWPHMDQ